MNITSCNVSLRYAPGITTKQIPIPTQIIQKRYLRSNYSVESDQPFTTLPKKNVTTFTSTDNNTVYISSEQKPAITEVTINPFVRIHLRQA